jgi:hypothetical protein
LCLTAVSYCLAKLRGDKRSWRLDAASANF